MNNDKLHNIKKTGFKTPDHYFESIEDTILNKLKEESPINTIKNTGFKTPDQYFENLENNVLSQLAEEKAVKVIPLFSKRNILYASSIAAVVLIMLGVFYNKADDSFDTLDAELVETYLQEQDLSTYDLAALFSEEDFAEDGFIITNDNFSEASLEDYLLDNTNLEDLIEQ